MTHISVPCIKLGSGLKDSFSVLWDFFENFSSIPARVDWLWRLRSIFTPLQIVLWVNATWKDTSTIERKTARAVNHSLLQLSITLCCACFCPLALPYTVLTYFNVERLIFFSKILVREKKCKQKHCISCTFTLMQTANKLIFHACACVVRLQVLICYVNTRLKRIINRFC